MGEVLRLYEAECAPKTYRRVASSWRLFLSHVGAVLPDELVVVDGQPDLVEDYEAARRVVAVLFSGGRSLDGWAERDRALVGVIVVGALGLGDVVRLRIPDVIAIGEGAQLVVRNHQGGRRVVDLPARLTTVLGHYLASRQDRLGNPGAAGDLFVHVRGRPYTTARLRYLYTGWFARAGLAVPPAPPAAALRPVWRELAAGSDGGGQGRHETPAGGASRATRLDGRGPG